MQELHAMARAGKSWEFLDLATGVAEPDDALRLLISATCARLGLATLAREAASALSPATRAGPQGTSLAAAIAKLPHDVVPFERRMASVARNLPALAARGIDVEAALAQWRVQAQQVEVFGASDGGIAVRPAASADFRACKFHVGPARIQELVARAIVPDESMGAPLAIPGANPPWLIRIAYDATKTPLFGYQRRITILEPDPIEFVDALAACDLTDVLSDERVELLIGPGCNEQFRSSLELRSREQFEPIVLAWKGEATTPESIVATSSVRGIVADVLRGQREELARLVRSTDAYYASLSPEYFRRRFAEALEHRGEPLRVLIPTCRYSTFVKHAAADLANAFRRAGHTAEILIEERSDARMSELAYRHAIRELKPDLIVVINYPRACMGNAFPKSVPFVCWVQDAMPHLFSGAVGQAQGPLDFVVGHTHLELFQKFGYPIERAMSATVVADAAKFHPAPVAESGPHGGERFLAEIALVTHHSETPEAMHARLCREAAKAPKYVQLFERLFGDLARAVDEAATAPMQNALQSAVQDRMREVLGTETDARAETLVVRQYAGPMADRMLRHQTIHWAAGLARRRGWRLHLHGRGWEKHATLAEFARPELAHGEALRAAYQTAAVTLHVAGSTLSHQRVFECFLSGGLCLSRMHRELVSSVKGGVQRVLLQRQPDVVDEAKGMIGYRIADHPEAMEVANKLGAIGHPYASEFVWIKAARVESIRNWANALSDDLDATFFLRDLAETTFATASQLESMVEKAIHGGEWRSGVTEMVSKRVREHLTHDALARRMLGFLRDSIGIRELREAV